jgi:alkylhydroperoxidase family enzyme
VRRRGTKHAASPAKQIPARIGPAEFSTLGAMIACAATQDLDPLHLRDARKAGESQERLDLIGAWREAPVFSSRERAALAWTEAVTLVADTHVPDDVYEAARVEFSEQE